MRFEQSIDGGGQCGRIERLGEMCAEPGGKGSVHIFLRGVTRQCQRGNIAQIWRLASQERQHRSMEALFKAGENDRLTLVSAQVELQAARLSRLEALFGAQQALNALEDASGVRCTSPVMHHLNPTHYRQPNP